MCAVGEENSPLVTKCMDFCRALATQGEAFNFSLSIGSSFSFSLDTRSKEIKKITRTKKPSPSTLRRNAKRRQDFLNMKQNPSAVSQTAEVATVPAAPLCDMCDYKAASEKGLKTHKRMKHGPPRLTPTASTPFTPEKLRGPGLMRSSLNTSPLSLSNREENCHNCGGPFSPSHQCDGVGDGDEEGAKAGDQAGESICTCDCPLPICCVCLHDAKCLCFKDTPDGSCPCTCEAHC